MISRKDLTYLYHGETVAIEKLTAEFPQNENIAVIGEEKSGKTTLFRILCGAVLPSSGAVTVNGLPAHSPERATTVGYAPTRPALEPSLTVKENLRTLAALCSLPRESTERAIASVALSEDELNSPVGTLPLLASRKASIAAAILYEPEILLLDQPLSGLSREDSVFLSSVISALSEKHTLIYSTDSPEEACRFCKTALVLSQGKQIAFGPLSELTSDKRDAETVFLARLKGDEKRVSAALAELDSVRSVAAKKSHTGTLMLEIRIENTDSANEALSKALLSAGCAVLELKRADSELEAVFSRLREKELLLAEEEAEEEESKAPPIKLTAAHFALRHYDTDEEGDGFSDGEHENDGDGDE